LLAERIGSGQPIEELPFGKAVQMGDVSVSLHPAGHVLGSCQIRIEHRGDVCVFGGDYKLAADSTCAPFESVPCNTFVTESTFGLPIYRWLPPQLVHAQINEWWRRNAEEGCHSVLYAYSLGKAQRVLAQLDASIGPILCHASVMSLVRHYRAAAVVLPPCEVATVETALAANGRSIFIAPPAVEGGNWLKKIGEHRTASASGWMQLRGTRRRRNLDRGFVLSDHADWPGLMSAIEASGAEEIAVTHGYIDPLVRYLNESGRNAFALPTQFAGEAAEEGSVGVEGVN